MAESKTILVVEDNDFVRMQTVKFLQSEGYAVVESTDGKDALDKIQDNEEIDMAIVDVRMEPMGGFEFIRTIQGLELNIPSILVTGDQNPDLLSDAQKLGVGAVLMKPVERDRLIKTVQRVLQIKERSS